MTWKEEGESYEGLPGLSWMIPLAFFRQGGWKPLAKSNTLRPVSAVRLMPRTSEC